MAVVFDLDGVVIRSRDTYRQSYCEAVNSLAGRSAVKVDDVHRLKRDPAYNAPWDSVRALLELAGLPHGEREIASALALSREHYAGSANVERLYGVAPTGARPGPGLCEGDELLIPTELGPLPIPIAVFTGRDEGEARWVIERFRVFDGLPDEHLWHAEGGVDKPDPTAFLTCLQRLTAGLSRPLAGPVLYLGDLAADAETVARYRALPGPSERPAVVFALIGDEGPAERADLHLPTATPILQSLVD